MPGNHQFDARKGKLRTWVKRVIINSILQQLRKRKIQFAQVDINDLANYVVSDENVLAMLSAKEITQLVQQLPEGYRIVFNLFMIEGYSHKEIAQQLNITTNTSKTQLRKARLALQKRQNVFGLDAIIRGVEDRGSSLWEEGDME